MSAAPMPFWERRGTAAHDARRLLVISYHFPPDTTIGARRWEQLAHAVTNNGWGLDVVTCAPGAPLDGALDSLPAGVRVYGVTDPALAAERVEHVLWRAYRKLWPNRRLEPNAAGAASTQGARELRPRPESLERAEIRSSARTPREMLRTYWAWVDYTRGGKWARHAAALALRITQRGVHRAVITSAPPHMSHEAGRIVSVASGLPFVMDMRDQWSMQPWLPEFEASPLWYRRAERHETACIAQASLVIANTDPAREALVAAYPDARSRIITVMNGTDDNPLPPHRDAGKFLIGYAGTIYLDRDPQMLFRAAARVIAAEGLTPAQLAIVILGRFAAEERSPMFGMAVQEGIGDFVTVEPPRPHRAALEFLANATMLVVFPGNNRLALPAKVFEYIRFDSWLLAIGEPESAIARLLRDTTADVVTPDVDALTAAIRARYREYTSGVRPVRVARDQRFSRAAQARILLDAIARVSEARGVQARAASPP